MQVTSPACPKITRKRLLQFNLYTQAFCLLVLLLSVCFVQARQASANDLADQLRQQVEQLTKDDMEGRGPGTEGIERAADLLDQWMTHPAIQPAFRSQKPKAQTRHIGHATTRQRFTIREGITSDQVHLQVGHHELCVGPDRDVTFLGFGRSTSFENREAVFLGFGVQAPQQQHDDYAAFVEGDLTNKLVIVFRYEPTDREGRSLWVDRSTGRRWTRHAHLDVKAKLAERYGAAAIIFVTPPSSDAWDEDHEDERLRTTEETSRLNQANLPVFHVSAKAASRWFRHESKQLRPLYREALASASKPFFVNQRITGGGKIVSRELPLDNLGYLLPGSGDLANETLILMAHYDHLGYGPRFAKDRTIHPGANDNASGVAATVTMMQHLATRLPNNQQPHRRNLLLLLTSGEERGLLGSKHFVAHLKDLRINPDQIVAAINLDMVGTLNDKPILVGFDQPRDFWLPWLNQLQDAGLSWQRTPRPIFQSDHASFARIDIPALFLTTGLTEIYHTPQDKPDTLDYTGLATITSQVEQLIWNMLHVEQHLASTPKP